MIRFIEQSFLLAACLISCAIVEFLFAATAYSAPRQCIPIAYVLSKGDKRFKPGDLICVGDTISLRDARSLLILCFATGEVVELQNGKIASPGCGIPQETQPQVCGNDLTFCVRPRGGMNARLKITEPYGSNIVNLRPQFRWQKIAGATSYRVRLLGNVVWSRATTQPQLIYPENQPALKPGSAYRVIVSAYRGDQLIVSGEQILNVIPSSQTAPISTKADQK